MDRGETPATDVAATLPPEPALPVLDGIQPRQHLSVVTVQDRAWIVKTDTTSGNPDRTGHGPAQGQVRPWVDSPAVQQAALTLASTLRLGLSRQDWIVDDDGPILAKLDPYGGWLQFPDEVARPVTDAVADWLAGRCP